MNTRCDAESPFPLQRELAEAHQELRAVRELYMRESAELREQLAAANRAISEGNARLQHQQEATDALIASTKARQEQSSQIGNLTHNLVMASSMLRRLVNGWQSDMTATKGYDELVWEARALLDRQSGLDAPK